MKKNITLLFTLLISVALTANEYLVVSSNAVKNDSQWAPIVEKLSAKHDNASVIYYENHPDELLTRIQEYNPRYIGIVEKPERLGREYVIRLNQFSRTIDNDIYADFLWGIITGYTPAAAERMINDSYEPLVLKRCMCWTCHLVISFLSV